MPSWFSSLARESFLVLRVLPDWAESLSLNLENGKRFVPGKIWREADVQKLIAALSSRRSSSDIVVALDPVMVHTVSVPVSWSRESPKEPISETELENFLAQTAGKVFNHCRQEAAEHLGLDDLEVVLAGSRVADFRLDGHRVLNPAGFEARKIETSLEFTLVGRALFQKFKPLTAFLGRMPDKRIFFTATARAELLFSEKFHRLPLALVVLGRARSYSMALHRTAAHNRVFSRADFKWRVLSLVQVIAEAWAVNAAVAEKIYSAYLSGGLSRPATRVLERMLSPALGAFIQEAESARFQGKVFLDSDLRLPLSFPVRKKGFSLEDLPLAEVLAKAGLETDGKKWPVPESDIFRWLAPVLEFRVERSGSSVNHWLRRHLQWLGSPV